MQMAGTAFSVHVQACNRFTNGGSAKVDATIGSEAALIIEFPTSLQALHLTAYVTPIVKFDKMNTSSTDVVLMSECS